jgi:hypothetical protein
VLYFAHRIQRAADAAVVQSRNSHEMPETHIPRGAIRANLYRDALEASLFLTLANPRQFHTEARLKPLTSAAERVGFLLRRLTYALGRSTADSRQS